MIVEQIVKRGDSYIDLADENLEMVSLSYETND